MELPSSLVAGFKATGFNWVTNWQGLHRKPHKGEVDDRIMAYSFTVSFVILTIMNQIPGLRLRVSETDEMSGLDASQIGEYAFEALTEKES